ncbi:hypothetical protein [Algoriphagus confluentis]|uniref:hypothetical protein n=1 Tax=Algoriphagus confluentis TaxID=1697556 RepID=UPI0030C69C44
MKSRLQILCKSSNNSDQQEIPSWIGGKNNQGELWSLPIPQAIEGMKTGKWDFFINFQGKSFEVELDQDHDPPRLTTKSAGRNLFQELPDCPERK